MMTDISIDDMDAIRIEILKERANINRRNQSDRNMDNTRTSRSHNRYMSEKKNKIYSA